MPKDHATTIGRSHLTGYSSWPPPHYIHKHLSIFVDLINTLAGGGSVLDLGCGDGSIDRLLAERSAETKVTGVDLEAHEQWQLKKPTNLQFQTASVYQLPFKAGSFDTVIMKDVLHHLPDPDKVIKQITKLARQQVIIIEANRYNPISYVRMVKVAKHEHFSRARLKKLVGQPAKFISIETHVWPGRLHHLGRTNDFIFNKLPLLSRLRNYNIVTLEPNSGTS